MKQRAVAVDILNLQFSLGGKMMSHITLGMFDVGLIVINYDINDM
ncbi:hypothetical protein [Vibrio sinensis]|nr:hypothetical protein [Vibrio sinensis]